jgi:molybdopterin-containing oxidoreductase family iron-sulfur binding subunit
MKINRKKKMAKKMVKKNKSKDKKPSILSRRDILQIAGATGGAALITGLVTSGPLSPEAVSGIKRQSGGHGGEIGEYSWQMVIDLEQCIGCQYCMKACQAINDVPEDDMRWNVGFPERTVGGTDFFMTRPCMHCQDAPCVKVCPVGATWIREDGIVAMDYDRCIGCRYCQVACPYDARRFNWKVSKEENPYQPTWGSAEVERRPRGVIEKCTFCTHRIDRGIEQGLTPGVDPQATPACVNACPVGARIFGNAKDPNSPVSKYMAQHETFRLREDFGTQPSVHYVRPEKES